MKFTTFAMAGAIALASTGAFTATASAQETDAAAIVEAAIAGGDAVAGEKVFKKCKACHMVGEGAKNRTGPDLNGIVGAQMGIREKFKYSKGMVALSEAGDIWTLENLDAWLAKPKDFIAKTKMSFAGLKDEEDRANVIAYLAGFEAD